MKKSREILGLTVVSIQEGKELGTVNQLVIDATTGTVEALLIDDGKWYLGAKALPFSAINGLGENAVTISREADMQLVSPSSRIDNLLNQNINVVGTLALTRGGNISGTVVEIVISDDGKVTECLIENADEIFSLSAQCVKTYGKDVLIISTENEVQPVRHELLESDTLLPISDAQLPIIEEPVREEAVQYEETLQDSEVVQEQQEQSEPAKQEADALAKMFEEKQRKYLLGKKASRRIEAESGIVVIEQGDEITEAVLQKAKLAGKFVELSMSVY